MDTIKVKIETLPFGPDRWEDVETTYRSGGLAVHRCVETGGPKNGGQGPPWAITHIGTGLAIMRGLPSEEIAKRLLEIAQQFLTGQVSWLDPDPRDWPQELRLQVCNRLADEESKYLEREDCYGWTEDT